MRIYVTRHGETEYSRDGIVCGTTDCPLTDFGREQAISLAREIERQHLKFGIVYTSPLLRAKETAEIVAKAFDTALIVDPRLREQDCGAYEGRVPRNDRRFSAARMHFANRLDGGESSLQLAQRIYGFLDDLIKDGKETAPLIVGHACVCKMIHTYFHELTNEEYFEFKLGNCELLSYEFQRRMTEKECARNG